MFKFKRFSALSLSLFIITHAVFADSSATRVNLANLSLPLVSKATLIGPTNPDDKITFTVWLNFRNQDKMDQLAHDIYDPQNARYHHFMTKDEYQTLFSALPDTTQTVQKYFIDNGMNADIIYNTIRVTGTAKQVEQLFHIKMNNYRYHDKTYYGTPTTPSVTASIAQYVHSVSGLTNIPRFEGIVATATYRNHSTPIKLLTFGWKSFAPNATPTTASLNGFDASTLQHVYQIASIAPIYGKTIDGTDQTIVITDGIGNSPAQIMTDANIYGGTTLPAFTAKNFAAIDQYGNPCRAQCTGSSGSVETAIDVESSHTLAPHANMVLVLGDTDIALSTAIQILIQNHFSIGGFSNAYQISNSWGETGGESPSEYLEPYLELAMMSGIGVNFSSGDCGDRTSGRCNKEASANVLYPASSGYSTAVGATSLFVDTNWNYAFEVPWGDYFGQNSTYFYYGTTGGISKYFGPVSWQNSINDFIAGGYSGTVGSHGKRADPDISMLGDPVTGLQIVINGQVQPGLEGGTSLACPLFTAVEALTNQARAVLAGGQNPIGQAAPALYNNQVALVNGHAINLVVPPHQIIGGATKPSSAQVTAGAPLYAFSIYDNFNQSYMTFGWDSSLQLYENQFWNDSVGLGSVNVPNFVALMSGL
jgi:subtilase family serine protease